MKKRIERIKTEYRKIKEKTDDELIWEIEKLKKSISNKDKKNFEQLIEKWFAIVQETSFRKIGLKHYDTQLLAGLFLNEGKIVEMKTGEGKTLASTLSISFNALFKKGVHVITVNDYLAERDQKWMGKIYEGLGLSSGLVTNQSNLIEKKRSYESDITYVTNSELVFDYLRDNSGFFKKEMVQRPFYYCVIDEIDSILIDEARTPLILSSLKDGINEKKLSFAKILTKFLEKEIDFQIDEKRKEINLTEIGYRKITEKLGKKSLYDADDPWILEILNSLKAKYLFKLNKDYIVLNKKIVIVDEFTGRIMEDRRWSLGIHEAIEIKENLKLGGGTKTKSSITYQNFFPLYPRLSGMTGTGKTTEKEFQDIYNLEVVVIPTSKPMIRQDLPDLVYQSELSKWKGVLEISKKSFKVGQPLLIGTSSVEKSEFLSELFQVSQIPHQVLNAKPENLIRENEIIAQAGQRFAITIATNMAGRGTDIILGGNPLFQIKELVKNIILSYSSKDNFKPLKATQEQIKKKPSSIDISIFKKRDRWKKKIWNEYLNDEKKLLDDIANFPYSLEKCQKSLKTFYNSFSPKIFLIWEKENQIVKNLGGLFVLGTERHETRRIDNQLRGRAGRQGDPGISQFFVSLEDDLIKLFGGENIRKWMSFLVDEKDIPLESSFLTKSLENAQKKVELYNYDIRKNIFEYDDILNSQRKKIIEIRNQIVYKSNSEIFLLRENEGIFDEYFFQLNRKLINNSKVFSIFFDFEKIVDSYATYFFQIYWRHNKKEKNRNHQNLDIQISNFKYHEIWISHDFKIAEVNFYQIQFLKTQTRKNLLAILDTFWTEHIERMGYIKDTINWRSYGQLNPLLEYNLEATKSFQLILYQMRSLMIYFFLSSSLISL